MKRVVTATLFSAALGGCALLINLGDEPALLPGDGGAGASAADAPADSRADVDDDAAPGFKCGLRSSQHPECRKCIEALCCDVTLACAGDPECTAGVACAVACLANPFCTMDCLTASKTDRFNELTSCSASNCAVCTPGPRCRKLGQCCGLLAAGPLRTTCSWTIMALDEDACEAQRLQIGDERDAAAGDPCR